MTIDLAFCVLQYGAAADTMAFIDSIRKWCADCSYHVVIVDNQSPDDAYEVIRQAYAVSDDVTVIQSGGNIGFARGNNVGIRYIREHFEAEFIVAANSDILLVAPDLYKKIKAEYEISRFAVLGPQIFTRDGRYTCNPVRKAPLTREQVVARMKLERKVWFFCQIDYLRLIKLVRVLKNAFHPKKKPCIDPFLHLADKAYNVQLHGSFMVFSKAFFEVFEGFDPSTYMYMEEYLLYKHCLERGLTTVFVRDIPVFHKEDVSLDQSQRRSRKKEIFVHKHSWHSAEKLLELYDHYEKQD